MGGRYISFLSLFFLQKKMSQQTSSSSSRAITRELGQWNNARRLAAIDAMIRFRPSQQRQQNKSFSWAYIYTPLNNTSPNLGPLFYCFY